MNMFQDLFVNLSLSPKQQELTAYLIIIPTNIKIDPLACYDFSKNCDVSYFSQFLETSQFLLETLVPPLPLEFSNFSKNCDFFNFSQFLLLRANLDMLICNKHAFYALGARSPAHICTIRTKRRLCLPRAQSLNLSLGALVLKDVNFQAHS